MFFIIYMTQSPLKEDAIVGMHERKDNQQNFII